MASMVFFIQLTLVHLFFPNFRCGKRGGYLELTNFHESVREQLYKLASIGLCPNLVGQVVVDVMVNPPKPGDESYELCIPLSFASPVLLANEFNDTNKTKKKKMLFWHLLKDEHNYLQKS
jgi:aspartate/methionine/tyrosine aminotransferase